MLRFAKVIMDLSLDRTFDYAIPGHLLGQVHQGSRVLVPFHNSTRKGYVVELISEPQFKGQVKKIEAICGSDSMIPPKLLELGEWMAEYYCCSREQAVKTLMPGSVRKGSVKRKTLSIFSLADISVAENYIIEKGARAKARIAILKELISHTGMTEGQILRASGASKGILKILIKEGLVIEEKCPVDLDEDGDVGIIPEAPMKLNGEQAAALGQINEMASSPDGRHVMLLHGVTGSGKTEVYLQAIAGMLEQEKESIILVPEISLTPQTVSRFRARFGDRLSVLHSRLTPKERFREWIKVLDGKVKIAVGARSALFAPFKKLGLIVVDEEHETSYKQSESPRYSARDVAVMRGMMENAVVVLGSATPSFESYNNAISGKYVLAKLTERADKKIMPVMRVVDIRHDAPEADKLSFFSKMLINAVRERIAAGEQTIIFLNRRGYARQMMCEHCGFVARCPDCSVTYTYHKKRQTLSCHLCGAVIKAYLQCPECGAEDIRYSGIGTEKIEAMARKLFHGARIERMDSDTMTRRDSYEKVLNDFKKGQINILIGTQMIAKGLHFPNVTLVGIIYADQSLHIPDFRAEERTFQLLTQVAGRAGRGEIKGEVIVQTFSPFNPAIQYALKHDFENFFEDEMEIRRQWDYPPCGHLIAVFFRGPELSAVSGYAKSFIHKLKPALDENIHFTEPAPAPIERIKGLFRYMLVFRGTNLKKLRKYIKHEIYHGQRPKDVDVYADVDAISMM